MRIQTLNKHMKERGDSLLEQTQKWAKQFSNTFLSWKRNIQRWRQDTSWKNGETRCWSCQFKSWANNADYANMDVQIPGPPHSVVKHALGTDVRKLIRKIENHPDGHVFQQDLRQNQAYDRFNPGSKKMIQEVDNIELCELIEKEPKRSAQCVHHIGISVDSTARAGISCMKKEVPINNSSIFRWTLFQSVSMSSRRWNLMDIDMVKSRKTHNVLHVFG